MNASIPRLSLIIPCYNEERTLRDCVNRCLALRERNIDLELVIVDDCSTDKSLAVAHELEAEFQGITVVRHAVNKGKGAALRTGFLHASGDYVGIQDADQEYNPLDYLKLLVPLMEDNADVVYGSRYLRRQTRRVLSFWHTWMNRTLTFISDMFTGLDISDMETCYKLFSRAAIAEIAPQLKEERFGFEPEVTALVAQKRFRVYECSIHYEPRSYEEGKKIGWRDGVHALYCILHYSAHCASLPMQVLIYFCIGLVCALTNISVFSTLIGVGFSAAAAIWIAFLLAAGLNYLLCITVLFRHKARWSGPREIAIYIACVLFMGCVDYALTSGFIFCGISPYWSKVWSTLLGFLGNFLLRKFCVF